MKCFQVVWMGWDSLKYSWLDWIVSDQKGSQVAWMGWDSLKYLRLDRIAGYQNGFR